MKRQDEGVREANTFAELTITEKCQECGVSNDYILGVY